MNRIVLIATTDRGLGLAQTLQPQLPKSVIMTTRSSPSGEVYRIENLKAFLGSQFDSTDAFVFISALGACVRLIAPYLKDKATDPAVVCVDDHGKYAQPVVGGHQGGANHLATKIAQVLGGSPIISTSSDLQQIWALDTLGKRFGWATAYSTTANETMSLWANNTPTVLLLEVNTIGTQHLENSLPDFVDVYYHLADIDYSQYGLLLVVSYRQYDLPLPTVHYHPPVLSLGTGCSKALATELFDDTLQSELAKKGIAFASIKNFGSVDIKAQQEAYLAFGQRHGLTFHTYDTQTLATTEGPNPSETVASKIGITGVSEPVAMLLSGNDKLLVEKQKVLLDNGQKYTYAIGIDYAVMRRAAIAIVGAGPGDEALISVKGQTLLKNADCVLYAGSLVPEGMLGWCKQGAVVRNSATMTLEEQMALMQAHYKKGHKIVRLHSGDPSIYGAIQEQMTLFEEQDMDYEIVPGISAFSAAAAVLKSEFTIPDMVQTIIITRGEGKTPMPEAEKLEQMAKLKATMCLFLSATIAKKVQGQLLQHYAPDTPVAVLYRLTWPDQEVHQGVLEDLAQIVRQSKKTRTVLIVVGTAINARHSRSQLYHPKWKHIFRTGKTPKPSIEV